MLPAHEGLEGFYASRAQDRLRLVVQDELIVVDRVSQLGDEAELRGIVVIKGSVIAQHPSMLRLGYVHRDVGPLQQRVGVGPVRRRDGKSDTRLNRQRQPADLNFTLDHAPQTAKGLLSVG